MPNRPGDKLGMFVCLSSVIREIKKEVEKQSE